MYETFENLPENKKKRIINAAYEVFGRHGYNKASIGDIANAACVSKAALFHYFGTKQEMYFYIYDFAAVLIASKMQEGTQDLFESIRLSTKAKLQVFQEYPAMYHFLESIVIEPQELLDELKARNQECVEQANKLLFKNIDWSRLRTANIQEAMKLLTWVTEGCIRENLHLSFDETVHELDKYLEYIKRVIYKEDE